MALAWVLGLGFEGSDDHLHSIIFADNQKILHADLPCHVLGVDGSAKMTGSG